MYFCGSSALEMQVYVVASYCVFEGTIYNFNLWSYHNMYVFL